MNTDDKSPANGVDRFCTTRWSAVLLSAQSELPGSQAALAELCKIYWYPIYTFVRRRGYGPDDAEDLTQGFFLHLLDHKALRQVSPVKGKFRSFLAASLQNYLLDFVPLDTNFAEHRCQLGKLDVLTADKIFDARWAITLLDTAMTRLSQQHAAQGKTSVFETLKPYIDPINSKVSLSYEQVANALGVSLGAVKTLIHRLRKQFRELVKGEIAGTVETPAQIQDELRYLIEVVA